MNKIFLYCVPYPSIRPGDVLGFALAEDGNCLANHLSSSEGFSQHDMGLTSDWKHDAYDMHYPYGYVLEWVDDPDSHEGWKAAYELNQQSRPTKGD